MGFWPICENFKICVGIAVHKQYSLLDTMFNYIFPLGPPGKNTWVLKFDYPSAGIVGFLDLFIDIFQEVQNEKYSHILYLIDYIAYGPQFQHKFWNSPTSAKNPKCVIVTPVEYVGFGFGLWWMLNLTSPWRASCILQVSSQVGNSIVQHLRPGCLYLG